MKRIIFATNNEGKAREIKAVYRDLPLEVLVLKDLGVVSEPEENGDTFAENARIKALDVYEQLKHDGRMKETIVMADDSGLCIDFFGGGPGVHSARFMGHETSYEIKNRAILEQMKDVPDESRGAAFVCHVTAVTEDGRIFDAESAMEGAIARKAEGELGFGYDPIFYVPEYGKVSGLLTEEEKNSVSHRGKVLRKMKEILCRSQLI